MLKENENLNEKYFTKIIEIYESREKEALSYEEIGIVSRILLKLEYFIKLERIVGYAGIELFATNFKLRYFKKDQIILKIGEENQIFYVILKGELDIYPYNSSINNTQKKIATLKQGKIFGNYFTSSKKKTNSTIVCQTDVTILQISHQEFLNILNETDQNTIEKCNEILKKFDLFENLTRSTLQRIYFTMEKKKYRKGEIVFKEGDDIKNNGIYFIYSGEFMVLCIFLNYFFCFQISKSIVKEKNKLKILNREIDALEKERNILLTSMRGYNPDGELIKSLYEKIKINDEKKEGANFTKDKLPTVKVIKKNYHD